MNHAQYIDHTILKPEASEKDIDQICQEAKAYGFKTVCVASSWVKHVKKKLGGTSVGITSVIGFPHGTMATQVKVFEAKLAVAHGADEIDMVIQIGKLKDGQEDYILNDINKVKAAIGHHILKVIIETALLTELQIRIVTKIVKKSHADFIKTSTGFSYRGASREDIKILKEILGQAKAIKAAGGIQTLAAMEDMIQLGATRIGTSAGVALMTKAKGGSNY